MLQSNVYYKNSEFTTLSLLSIDGNKYLLNIESLSPLNNDNPNDNPNYDMK